MASRSESLARALLVSTVTALCACGGGAARDGSPHLPEAEGSVRAERQGDQLVLDIRIDPTAAPGELDPKATVFVAWAKPARGGPARNLGALALRGDRGELRARTQAEELSLIITAEPAAEVATPNGPTVLWAYVPAAQAAQAAAPNTRDARAGDAGPGRGPASKGGELPHAAQPGAPSRTEDAGAGAPAAAHDGDASVQDAGPGQQQPGAPTAEPCDCDPRADAGAPCPAVPP